MPIKKTSLFPAVHIELEDCGHCKWLSVCMVKECAHVTHGRNVELAKYNMQFHLYAEHGIDRSYAKRFRRGVWP